ncbi:MAG TPA: MFS transporter, partial [Nitrospiraceae bacterium]|nr:MFS transporter [Nitrospiraceae bacterium]
LGALLGPLIVAGVLLWKGQQPAGYQPAFALLAIPALLALSLLFVARLTYPQPERFELNLPPLRGQGFSYGYWIYVGAAALIAAGYADFPLIAYHFKTVSILPDSWIPVLYGIAMGVDGLAALLFGRLFDRLGLPIVVVVAIVSSAFAPLVFLGGRAMAVAGMAVWGLGLGAQETVMKAAIPGMVPSERRGSAYGIFNMGYGLCWFLGSALMGYLYDLSVPALAAFSVGIQLVSIPLFMLTWRLTARRS